MKKEEQKDQFDMTERKIEEIKGVTEHKERKNALSMKTGVYGEGITGDGSPTFSIIAA